MDDPEIALVSFISSDPAVLELIQTKPSPPRIFPDAVPQGQPRDKPAIVYSVLAQTEGFALAFGPHSFANATLSLECRAASRKQAKLLRKRVLESKGGNPDGRKLNGFAGYMGEGYEVQIARVENSYYEYEPPIKDTEVGVYIAAVEITLCWNNSNSLL